MLLLLAFAAPPFAPPLAPPFAPALRDRNCETTRLRRPLSCCRSCSLCVLFSWATSHVMSDTVSIFCGVKTGAAGELRA